MEIARARLLLRLVQSATISVLGIGIGSALVMNAITWGWILIGLAALALVGRVALYGLYARRPHLLAASQSGSVAAVQNKLDLVYLIAFAVLTALMIFVLAASSLVGLFDTVQTFVFGAVLGLFVVGAALSTLVSARIRRLQLAAAAGVPS